MPIALGMCIIACGANGFAPMLQVYRQFSGLSDTTVTFLLGAYALGLIPALLIAGPLSDSIGRRTLMRPALVVSALASAIIALAANLHGAGQIALLGLGRFICGAAVGLVMASGAAWLREISTAPAAVSARRATIATSAGFGLGPLISGCIAQWLPGPMLTYWLLHILGTALIAVAAWRTPETVTPSLHDARPRFTLPKTAGSTRFLLSVAAWAPWAFGCATTSFATLAGLTDADIEHKIAWAGAIAALTMLSGVAIQPVASRLGRDSYVPPAVVGLGCAFVGMLLAWQIARTASPWWLIPGAIMLGSSYGIMMVSGLREVEAMAPKLELGGLIGVFYSLTYVGFFAPFVLSVAGPRLGYPPVFLFGALVIILSIYPVTSVIRRYQPEKEI